MTLQCKYSANSLYKLFYRLSHLLLLFQKRKVVALKIMVAKKLKAQPKLKRFQDCTQLSSYDCLNRKIHSNLMFELIFRLQGICHHDFGHLFSLLVTCSAHRPKWMWFYCVAFVNGTWSFHRSWTPREDGASCNSVTVWGFWPSLLPQFF